MIVRIGSALIDCMEARTPTEIQIGLTQTQSLGLGEGMIFIFDSVKKRSFWMPPQPYTDASGRRIGAMQFPIDIIFMDDTGDITTIYKNCQLGDRMTGYAKYIVEVPAGTCQAMGITVQKSATFGQAPPPPPPPPQGMPGMPGLSPPPDGPGSLPLCVPGMAPWMACTPNPLIALTQSGLTAYQTLIAAFPDFPTNFIKGAVALNPTLVADILGAPSGQSSQSNSIIPAAQQFFSGNASDLQTLWKTCQPIPLDQINSFATWLGQVAPGTSYTPAQMTALIEQQILGVANAFPALDLPTRVYNFLGTCLGVTANAAGEAQITAQIASLQTQEFAAMQAVIQSQANLYVAQLEALPATQAAQIQAEQGVPGTTPCSDLIYYLKQAVINPCQLGVISNAANAITTAQNTVSAIRAQIAAMQAQLVQLQQEPLTDTELINYLVSYFQGIGGSWYNSTNTVSGTGPAYVLQQSLLTLQRNNIQGSQLLLPIQNLIMQLSDTIGCTQVAFNNAHQAYLAAETSGLNLVAATAAYNTIEAIRNPVSAQLNAAVAQRSALMIAQPALFVDVTSAINALVMSFITDLVTDNPDQIASIVTAAMSVISTDCDNRSAALIAQRTVIINERLALFNQYYQIQANVKQQIYQDQVTQITTDFNDISAQVTAMAASIQSAQDNITNRITLLGGVIGNLSGVEGYTTDQFADPSFINTVLNKIQSANGLYDQSSSITAEIMGSNVFYDPNPSSAFPEGLGPSASMAADTLGFMNQMATAQANYNLTAPPLITQCQGLNDQLNAMAAAWRITVAYIQSTAYQQVLVTAFNQDPMNALLQSDIDGIATPLQQIVVLAASYQQTFSLCLDDLDKTMLTASGMSFTDTGTLSYADQQSAWFGAQAYLSANLPKYGIVSQAISDISARAAAGTSTEDDGYNLMTAKVCIANITAAQLIYRQLSNNPTFQNQLLSATEADALSKLPAVPSTGNPSAPPCEAALAASSGTQIGAAS